MGELQQRLKRDAERIDATVSVDLERRIDAALKAKVSERPAAQPARPGRWWWASSLTGATAALAIMTFLALRESPVPPVPAPTVVSNDALLTIDWQAETAMLTAPLEAEYDALKSDLERAEALVREDIGL